MTNQSTIDKLIEMRLTKQADAFPVSRWMILQWKEVLFEDRFGGVEVDIEYSNRGKQPVEKTDPAGAGVRTAGCQHCSN